MSQLAMKPEGFFSRQVALDDLFEVIQGLVQTSLYRTKLDIAPDCVVRKVSQKKVGAREGALSLAGSKNQPQKAD